MESYVFISKKRINIIPRNPMPLCHSSSQNNYINKYMFYYLRILRSTTGAIVGPLVSPHGLVP